MQEPTNSEILREIRGLDTKFTALIQDHEDRIKGSEKYINAQIAVAEYVSKNGTPAQKEAIVTPTVKEDEKPNTLAKTIAIMFSFFTGVIALITYIIQVAFNK